MITGATWGGGGHLVRGSTKPLLSGPDEVSARAGIAKIKHIVVVMQENRSFDSYSGRSRGPTGCRGTGRAR